MTVRLVTVLALDDMTDPDAWQTSAAALSIGAAAGGLELTGSAGAAGQFAQRSLPAPVDLTDFADLRLALRSDHAADGSADAPFFLELRLGADAAWHRFLPVPRAADDVSVLLSLADLAPAVRGALRTLRITCLDDARPFRCRLGAIEALRERMLADVDAALVARLAPVPATIAVPGATLPDAPFLRIVNLDVRAAEERGRQVALRTDFTAGGFTLRPPRVPYDLLYEISAIATERGDEAALIEHALTTLGSRGVLDVNGREARIEHVALPELTGDARPERVTLWFRIETSAAPSAAPVRATPPFQRVDLEVDQRASA